MKKIFILFFCGWSLFGFAQEDVQLIRKIYDEALAKGYAYEDLRSLCKDVGARLSGSAEAAMAVEWGKNKLESYGFDKVYLQEIKVPHWERGTAETGWIVNEHGKVHKLKIIALGNSAGTDGILEGEIIELQQLDELKELGEKKIKNKVVFFNRPYDSKLLNTFRAYVGCVDQRGYGAYEAAKYKAKAIIIRSMSSYTDDLPHTGAMYFDDSIKILPAAAISTNDADKLTEWLKKGKVKLKMEMDCRFLEDEISYNVIAELKGKKDDQIITIGGHLDSWDVGEGAHDDGAGIIHSMEALRILKKIKYQPSHTIRCVLFMNEENGNYGGKNYARIAKEKEEKHICAIESDRGGFLPLGFSITGTDAQVQFVNRFKNLLHNFHLFSFNKGYSGVDIRPLLDYYPDMLQLGLDINSQNYFYVHHAETDVFESVNKRELELGCAAMASMVYLLDKYFYQMEL